MSRVDLYPNKNSAPSEAQIQTGTVNGLKVGADVQVLGGTIDATILNASLDVNVTNAALPVESAQLTKRIDFISDSEFYKGEAAPGSDASSAVWRIQKVTIAGDGDVTQLWAGGAATFNNIWNNRASLTYS